MKSMRNNQRRGTILLMVVSLLAMLFVIVSGFLIVARFDEQTAESLEQGTDKDLIIDTINDYATGLVVNSAVQPTNGVMFGGKNVAWSTIPGGDRTFFLGSLNPVWRQQQVTAFPPLTTNGNFFNFANNNWLEAAGRLQGLVYPAVSAMQPYRTPGDDWPTSTRSVLDLIPEYAYDTDAVFDENDIIEAVRIGWMDADGDGIPDSDLMLSGLVSEMANALAGTPTRVPSYFSSTNAPGAFGFVASSNKSTPWLGAIRDPAEATSEALTFRNAAEEDYRRFLDNRSYDAAVRVIAHGGMIALDSAEVIDGIVPVQRGFVVDLFRATLNPNDTNNAFPWTGDRPNRFFNELAAQRTPVEAALRNRGGLLPPAIESSGTTNTPQILSVLQGDDRLDPSSPPAKNWQPSYPNTFVPALVNEQNQSVRPNGNNIAFRQGLSERINLADVDAQSEVQAVVVGLTGREESDPTTLANMDRRHQLTTISRSDELARRTRNGDGAGATTAPIPGLYRGERKFYLGEIAHAFRSTNPSGPTGSATANYFYAVDADATNDPDPGNVIVSQLARYYREMIDSHDENAADWGLLPENLANVYDDATLSLSQDEQAWMLAVNTVAFAAPRGADGWVPTVRYSRADASGNARTYVGYGAQPVISKVVMLRELSETSVPPLFNDVLAVQLYNPNTPYIDGTTSLGLPYDVYGLNPAQFRVAVYGVTGTTQTRLSADVRLTNIQAFQGVDTRFGGRTFASLVLREADSTDFFDGNGDPTIGVVNTLPSLQSYDSVRVVLEKAHRDENETVIGWWVVDSLQVRVAGSFGNEEGDYRWRAACRDTRSAPQLGRLDPGTNQFQTFPPGLTPTPVTAQPPRWNLITDWALRAGGIDSQLGETAIQQALLGPGIIRQPNASLPSGTTVQAVYFPESATAVDGSEPSPFVSTPTPTTPFISMNAAPRINEFASSVPPFQWQHGDFAPFGELEDLRPRSFPTVGFLHFVPRFSHVVDTQGATRSDFAPMSHMLRNQFRADGTPAGTPFGQFELPNYPADFGFMPVFDGDVQSDEIDLPWGQLIYDYFTTLNPEAEGADPLNVPGRIDINSASPLVMSALRMINPNQLVADLPVNDHRNPSPDFWYAAGGTLRGSYTDWFGGGYAERFDAGEFETVNLGEIGRFPGIMRGQYRLGTDLGYAITSYRDNVRSNPIAAGGNALADSTLDLQALSANGGQPNYRRLLRTQNLRRQGETGTRGFETLGELLNVKGMDGTRFRNPNTRMPTADGALTNSTRVDIGDYIGAVTMMALLDTQNLTTRSNTFTVYTSLMDRSPGEQDSSMRSQLTIDRSNLLPRLQYNYQSVGNWPNVSFTTAPGPLNRNIEQIRVPSGQPAAVNNSREPVVIAEKRGGYFNSQYDN